MFWDPKGKQLLTAIKNDDMHKVDKILQTMPALIEYADKKQNLTPLLLAIKCKNKKMIKLLSSYNVDVNKTIDHKDNPLIKAISTANDIEIVQQLIDHGANIDYVNKNGFSPLSVAIRKKDISIIELLLQKGVKRINLDPQNIQSDLLQSADKAFEQGKHDIARFIISCGLDTTYSALHAIKNNEIDKVKYYIQNGADIDECLKTATEMNNLNILKSLIPIDDFLQAAYEGELERVKILHQQIGNINIKDEDGHTALYAAVMKGNTAIVDYLLKNGADALQRYSLTFCPFKDEPFFDYLIARDNVTLKEFLQKVTENLKKDMVGNYLQTLKIFQKYDTSEVNPKLDEYFILEFKGVITQTASRAKSGTAIKVTKWNPVFENSINLPVSALCIFRDEERAKAYSEIYADIFKEKLLINLEYKSDKIKTHYRCSKLKKQEIVSLALENHSHVIIVDPVRITNENQNKNSKLLCEEILNIDQFK